MKAKTKEDTRDESLKKMTSDKSLKKKIILNSDNNRHDNVDVPNGTFLLSVIKADDGKKKRMKRTLSDSLKKTEELEDGPSVSERRLVDVDDQKRFNNTDRFNGSFLPSVNQNETKSVGVSPQSNSKKIQNGNSILDDSVNGDSLRTPSRDMELHNTDHIIGNGGSTKLDSYSEDGIENAKFTVGPSRQVHHSLLQPSRGKKRRRTKRNSDQNSSPFSPTNFTKTHEKFKPPTYQRINMECYVAVDCEMVGVGARGTRSALGRCSIVDYNGAVLYDKFVDCEESITDFRTIYSGITPEHLKTAEPFEKALKDIHNCLKNKVLIAHDIRNDLNVMHFNLHRYLVRDTSRCHMLYGIAKQNGYDVQENRLVPLKTLAKTVLGKDIQMGTKGHDSVEDARATMELFKRVRNVWEKLLFAKWSFGEGMNVLDLINGLNNMEDVCDAEGIQITDFHCNVGNGDVGQGEQDYLGDDFWPAM